jgi:hypothetical protein
MRLTIGSNAGTRLKEADDAMMMPPDSAGLLKHEDNWRF